MSDKAELLEKLKELGVHSNGRKVRSDKGGNHSYINKGSPRADIGSVRQSYDKTVAFHKKVFYAFIKAHTSPNGTGDDLIRDSNGIFPPNITNYYKLVNSRGTTYRSSVTRRNHPEKLRWAWWMAEHELDKESWSERVAKWYFIKPEDITLWTYDEWSWAYVKHIASHYNRQPQGSNIILSYDDFIKGVYTLPVYNEKGDIVWTK